MNRSATRSNNETITNEDTRRKMADHTEFGPRKTIIVLAIVAGCFAILWPKIFYPMISSPVNTIHTPIDGPACCDLIFESDVNAVDIMQEMCKNILRHHQVDPRVRDALKSNKLTPQSASFCRDEVLARCGIDLSSFLAEKERLGKTYKQVLEEIRTFNSSLCLKNQFGVPLSQLGTPHLIRYHILMPHSPMRQERRVPPHAGGLHPAMQQRGRAIPSSHIVPKVDGRPDHVVIEKMRPPLGAAGRVVPTPSGSNSMGIIMPLYTLGIFLFFLYTIAKVMRKNSDNEIYAEYQNPTAEREFRNKVFNPEVLTSAMTGVPCYRKERSPSPMRPVPTIEELKEQAAGDIEIDQLRQRLVDTEAAMERIVVQMGSLSRTVVNSQSPHQDTQLQDECVLRSCCRRGEKEVEELDESSPTVKVMGMEMTACCEGGQRISRPTTPIITHTHPERELTPPKPIYLEGALPPQCELLVTDSETQAENSEDDTEAPVVLSGKMTLSLISHDQNQAETEDESLEEKETPSRALEKREKRDSEHDRKTVVSESKKVKEGSEVGEGSEEEEEEDEEDEEEAEESEVEEDDEEDEDDENYEEDDEADEGSEEDEEEEIKVSGLEKVSGSAKNQMEKKVSTIVKNSTDDEDEDDDDEEEEEDDEEEEEHEEILDSEHNENEDSKEEEDDDDEDEEEEEEESEAISSEEEEAPKRKS